MSRYDAVGGTEVERVVIVDVVVGGLFVPRLVCFGCGSQNSGSPFGHGKGTRVCGCGETHHYEVSVCVSGDLRVSQV